MDLISATHYLQTSILAYSGFTDPPIPETAIARFCRHPPWSTLRRTLPPRIQERCPQLVILQGANRNIPRIPLWLREPDLNNKAHHSRTRTPRLRRPHWPSPRNISKHRHLPRPLGRHLRRRPCCAIRRRNSPHARLQRHGPPPPP